MHGRDFSRSALQPMVLSLLGSARKVPRGIPRETTVEHVFSFIPPAAYAASAEFPGSRRFVRKGIVGKQQSITCGFSSFSKALAAPRVALACDACNSDQFFSAVLA
jgi:hypothetical protein